MMNNIELPYLNNILDNFNLIPVVENHHYCQLIIRYLFFYEVCNCLNFLSSFFTCICIELNLQVQNQYMKLYNINKYIAIK